MSILWMKVHSLWTLWKQWLSVSVNRKIFGAAVIVAVLTGLAKVIGVGKELVVAWQYGTADAFDAFLIAYVVPSFVVNLLAGSLNAALIPTYIQVREQKGAPAAQELYASVMTLSLLFLLIAAVLVVLPAPLYLRVLGSGFDEQKFKLTLKLLYMLSPLIVFTGVSTIWGAVLNAAEKFALPALIPAVTPLAIAIFVIAEGHRWGIFALVLGTVSGQVAEMVLMGLALKRHGMRLRLRWHGLDASVRQVIGQYLPAVAAALLMGSNPLVDQSMAASLPSGNVAALNYGNRIVSLPLLIASTAIGTAALPYFSIMLAREDWKGARHTLIRYLKLIFGAAIPVTLLLVIFSEPLVRILFQRGAFTPQDTRLVAGVQAFGALQVPFYIGGILIVRMISSLRANRILVWASLINMIINIVMDYVLMKQIGVAGIALSTSIVYFTSFCFLMVVAFRILDNKNSPLPSR